MKASNSTIRAGPCHMPSDNLSTLQRGRDGEPSPLWQSWNAPISLPPPLGTHSYASNK